MLTGRTLTVKCVDANGTFWPLIFLRVSAPQCFPQVAQCELEENFGAHDFNCVASNTNVNYPVIAVLVLLRSAHKNPAGTTHLNALLDEDALVGLGYCVRDHPRRRASRCRARGGVFAVVEQHASVQTGRRIDGFTGHKVEELPASLRQVVFGAVQVDPQCSGFREGISAEQPCRGVPVDTVSIGSDASKSSTRNPIARATASRSCCIPKTGSI